MTSTISTSTKEKTQIRLSAFESSIPQQASSNSVDFASITADVPAMKPKTPKSIRLDEELLSEIEQLRGETNLRFNAYVETALEHFNACLKTYLSGKDPENVT